MTDFSAYIQSDWAWIVLFVMAIFVGMSKTGVQGLAILTVPMLAMTFGAKPSTGLMLPVLCFADVIGVSYYRRQAEWKYIIRLLPMAIAGFFLALWVDNMIPATEFKHLMGACLALKLPFQFFAWHNINLTTLAIDACAIPFVLVGAFIGIRIVKFLPERGFRIFTTRYNIVRALPNFDLQFGAIFSTNSSNLNEP